jgi:6-pyruvoyltetrahydropterin/6-carboxytetrahydropterin synthase
MISVTKKFEFEAAHHLPDYIGACQRLHGHSYKLEVTVTNNTITGRGNTPEGMIIDFSELKKVVNDRVLVLLDHSDLNEIFKTPTAENMVEWIANILFINYGSNLLRIRLYETSNSYAEWTK